MKFAVVIFPGTSGEGDVYHVLKNVLGKSVDYVWHEETDLNGYDVIILPAGTSYGDYIRAGAIARFSPIMEAVVAFAESGGLVLGIGNGFQILLEANLLPGALLKNKSLKFICKDSNLRVENINTFFTNHFEADEILSMPIAHNFGSYFCDEKTLEELTINQQIVFSYSSLDGKVPQVANYNVRLANIAGIINKEGNILGMMPHPERSSEEILGGTDGLRLFTSIINKLEGVGA